MPIATSGEQLALQASIREWAKRAGTLALVRRLEPGSAPDGPASPAPWDDHWRALAGLGIFSIALPAAAGGAGGTVADLAAALEQLTCELVAGPVMPALLAGLILRDHADLPAAKELLPALAAGQASVAVGLTTGTMTGSWLAGGALTVTGETGPVLGGGATTHLLVGAATVGAGNGGAGNGGAGNGPEDVWFLLAAGQQGVQVEAREPVDFSRPLATIRLMGATVAPGQILTGQRTTRVRDLAATLYAAEAAAVAGHCSATAAAYARTRHQFGRPIGSFQAVKHLCAGMLCRAERASAVAWDAARAVDEAPDEHPLAAAAAAALALDDAVGNAKDCIQVLGGIGFTWEHDAHLYLRRALALRQLLGGSAAWRLRAAELALGGARRHLGLTTEGADTEPAALAARSTAAAIAALPEHQRRAALADAGYAAPQWPVPYGLSASPAALLVIDEELNRAGLARPDLTVGGWAGQAILGHGTPAQQERFARRTLRGEITWCQLFSEPDAGSDLASVRTRAERADGGWRLTGQKVWTSLAADADWGICLARTDPAAPKHRGLTFFLVDMHSSGIEIRPLREITGRAVFNEVFLDGVFVPGDCVVGGCGDGWRVARSTLAAERVAMGRGSALGDAVEGLISMTRAGLASDPGAREQLGALVADGLAGSLLDLRSALAQLAGKAGGQQAGGQQAGGQQAGGYQAAVRKLAGVAHRQSVAETALTLCGPEGAASDGAAAAAVGEFLLTRCLSIAGGTSQILLNVVAERGLGLPREEVR